MAKETRKKPLLSRNQTIAENRKARFEYHLEDRFEAGIVLTGTEVKSLRLGYCSIAEAFADVEGGELWIINMHIPEYQQAGAHLQHDPKRYRKLMLKRKEINRLVGSIQREGYTLVPVRMYFNGRGVAKIELALAKGKKLHDKREDIQKRDWGRQKQRLLRDKG